MGGGGGGGGGGGVRTKFSVQLWSQAEQHGFMIACTAPISD